MSNQFAYAIRSLHKHPAVALTVILTISLGIGASTAMFSVTNAVLMQPLPYRNSDRLVVASGELRKRGVTDLPLSDPDFIDLRNGAKDRFEDLAAVMTGRMLLPQSDGTLEQVRFALVTPNFFELLGGSIIAGRDFVDADAGTQLAAQSGAAIVSHGYWQRRYGGDTSILGQENPTGGRAGPKIAGVLDPRFELLLPPRLNVERMPDIWFAARVTYDNAQRKTFT
ncbi:MAG: ABC transporter permease, partial [Bryobacteraceae bacterium]